MEYSAYKIVTAMGRMKKIIPLSGRGGIPPALTGLYTDNNSAIAAIKRLEEASANKRGRNSGKIKSTNRDQ